MQKSGVWVNWSLAHKSSLFGATSAHTDLEPELGAEPALGSQNTELVAGRELGRDVELEGVQGCGGPLNFRGVEIGVHGAGDTQSCGGTEPGTWSRHFPSSHICLVCFATRGRQHVFHGAPLVSVP